MYHNLDKRERSSKRKDEGSEKIFWVQSGVLVLVLVLVVLWMVQCADELL